MQICSLAFVRTELKNVRYVYLWAEFGTNGTEANSGRVGVWGYIGKAEFKKCLACFPDSLLTTYRIDEETNDLYLRLPLDAQANIA